jgi:hypothetical protein
MPQNNKITGFKKVAQAAIIKKMLMTKLGRYDYERFIKALYRAHKPQITKYIIDRILDNEDRICEKLYEVINYAFCWDKSPDGHAFWRGKDDDWREYVDQSLLRPEFEHVFKKTIA